MILFRPSNWFENFELSQSLFISLLLTVPHRSSATMLTGDIPPNQTIYKKNLNEKVNKEELKRSLYALFSQYGRILDIVALKTTKFRGQRIHYAKTKYCVAKADGSSVPRDKKKKQEEKAERRRQESQQSAGANGVKADTTGGPMSSSHQGKPSTQESAVAPNNILFIQNLPHETTDTMLEVLFKQYPGFREVRMIDAKPGIAFVEFEDDIQSAIAMEALRGFKITPQKPMAITSAKK